MRAGKGGLFVGFRCKLPRRGGSAVYLALLFVGGKSPERPAAAGSSANKNGGLRMTEWQASRRKKNSFLQELCWNVIENKGPPWKKWRQSGNVADYKGDKL